MKKRIIAVIMSVLLIISLAPSVTASSSSAKSVPAGFTPIYTRDDLVGVRNNLSGKYILMNDIALGDTYYGTWIPIGTSGNAFTGIFDGNSHVIRGLYINTTANYQGLFGFNCGTIKDLTVQGTVTGGEYVGGIVGASYKNSNENTSVSLSNLRNECKVTGTGNYVGGVCGFSKIVTESGSVASYISGCTNAGAVKGYEKYVGGIVGANISHVSSTTTKAAAASAYITKSSNAGEISGKSVVGGICGTNQAKTERSNAKAKTLAKIYMCSNTGKVTASSDAVGGICAVNDTTTYNSAEAIVDCAFNSGIVSGSGIDAGGIVSRNQSESQTTAATARCTVSNTYNRGAVSAKKYIGGIVGYNCANSEYGTCYSTITKSYSTGSIGKGDACGGIVGYTYTGANVSYSSGLSKVSKTVCTDAYYLAGTAASGIGHGSGSAASASAAALSDLDKSFGTTVWKQGVPYPEIKDMPVTTAYSTISGNVTIDGTLGVGKTIWPKLNSVAPASVTYTAKWYRDGKEIQTGNVYTLKEADYDHSLHCVLYATGRYIGNIVSETVTFTRPKLGGSVSIVGELRLGSVLKIDASKITPKGATYSVKWYRDGAPVSENETYTLGEADIDHEIHCVLTGKGSFGGSIASSTVKFNRIKLTGRLGFSLPVEYDRTVAPVLPDKRYTVNYEWKLDGKVVSTEDKYYIEKDAIGKTLTLTATGYGDCEGSLTASATVEKHTIWGFISLEYNNVKYGETVKMNLSAINWLDDYDYKYYVRWLRDGEVYKKGESVVLPDDSVGSKFTPQFVIDDSDPYYRGTVTGPSVTCSSWTNPFSDVISGAWYENSVRYAYENGLFSGTATHSFSPDTKMTRAMFVTVLSRLDGAKTDNNSDTGFTDVPVGKWYTGAVRWASENGITSGTSANLFCPDDPIDREQMCAMLRRYAVYSGTSLETTTTADPFEDEDDVSSYAKESVQIMHDLGLISGKTATRFMPKDSATRAEVSSILRRYCMYAK